MILRALENARVVLFSITTCFALAPSSVTALWLEEPCPAQAYHYVRVQDDLTSTKLIPRSDQLTLTHTFRPSPDVPDNVTVWIGGEEIDGLPVSIQGRLAE
jgi:hypothetical protein